MACLYQGRWNRPYITKSFRLAFLVRSCQEFQCFSDLEEKGETKTFLTKTYNECIHYGKKRPCKNDSNKGILMYPCCRGENFDIPSASVCV